MQENEKEMLLSGTLNVIYMGYVNTEWIKQVTDTKGKTFPCELCKSKQATHEVRINNTEFLDVCDNCLSKVKRDKRLINEDIRIKKL